MRPDNSTTAGSAAVRPRGWLRAHRWLLLRRISQLSILALFLIGPWFGVWLVKGSLASSMTLELLPLTDPHLLLQALVSGVAPESQAFIGAFIVTLFYLLVGGRVYCAWVCPVNMVTDTASWLRRTLAIRGSSRIDRSTRHWMLALTLILPLLTGSIVWELVNPVSMLFRGILFGIGLGWLLILGIFLFDLLVAKDGWCGRLCPVGAFYNLLGRASLLRVSADNRAKCNDCMECYAVCPEMQILKPVLRGSAGQVGPVILSSDCSNCGRCIDVCTEEVFHFTSRFNSKESPRYTVTTDNVQGVAR